MWLVITKTDSWTNGIANVGIQLASVAAAGVATHYVLPPLSSQSALAVGLLASASYETVQSLGGTLVLEARKRGNAGRYLRTLPLSAGIEIIMPAIGLGLAAPFIRDVGLTVAIGIAWLSVSMLVLKYVAQEQRFRTESLHDALTGLPNRRGFFVEFDKLIVNTVRTQNSFCLVMVDLDHFKKVNDEHGHDVGDEVLRRSASVLKTNLRSSDVIARLGGEEFVVLLPNTTLPTALKILERTRKPFRCCGPDHDVQTFSAGVAEFPTHGNSQTALLKAADEAVYVAKSNGRDRFEVAQSTVIPPVKRAA
jgi:diguanylate cyclase (GGDEF)-like protein